MLRGQNRYACSIPVMNGSCAKSRTIARDTLEARMLAGLRDRLKPGQSGNSKGRPNDRRNPTDTRGRLRGPPHTQEHLPDREHAGHRGERRMLELAGRRDVAAFNG